MTATAELALDEEVDYEVVDGRKEAKMAGARHGRTIMRLGWRLAMHVETNRLGEVYSPDTTFQIGAQDRLPDLSFISVSRLPAEGAPIGKWEMPPDLAVEVISPNDAWDKVKRKVRDYFAAGVQQVWLVSPEDKEVMIYDAPTRITVLTENDELTSATILPGFKCRVGDLFEA